MIIRLTVLAQHAFLNRTCVLRKHKTKHSCLKERGTPKIHSLSD